MPIGARLLPSSLIARDVEFRRGVLHRVASSVASTAPSHTALLVIL
jgi:hypothetical protein